MKKILTIVLLGVSTLKLISQNIGINGSGATPHPSALLDIDAVSSPSLGLLIPRIALQAINLATPVTSPATSLLVYNTATASTGTNAVSPGYYYWDGTKWVRFAYTPSGTSAEAWTLLGNAGTNSSTNFLGTTDNQDLVFRTNNTEYLRLTTTGILRNNLFSNAIGVDGQGISNNSLGFQNNQGAFTASFYNALSGNYSNGVLIKSLSTSSLSTLLDVSTGTVNTTGTPILNVKANGNVGIGTNFPDYKLHIKTSDLSLPAGFGRILKLEASHPAIEMYGVSGNKSGYIVYDSQTSGGIEAMRFYAGQQTGTFVVSPAILTLNASQNVGIGINIPTSKLHVKDITTTNIKVEGDGPDYTNATIELIANGAGSARGTGVIMTDASANNSWYAGRPYGGSGPTSNDVFMINRQNAPTLFHEASAIRDGGGFLTGTQNFLTIRNNGNVGINTTNPTFKLHVENGNIAQTYTTNTSHSIYMGNASGRNWQLYHLGSTDANAPNGFMFEHFDGSVWQRRMTINQAGNVGIEISNPSAKLHINQSALGSSGLTMVFPTTSFFIQEDGDHQSYTNIRKLTGKGFMFSALPDSPELVIKDTLTGAVGVGTKNPTTKLHIVSTASNTAFRMQDGTEGAGKVLTSDASGNATWQSPSALANYPYQSIGALPLGANCPVGGTYATSTIVLPAGIYYYTNYSCDGQIGASTPAGFNVDIQIVTGSGDSNGTFHDFNIGFGGSCGNYFTGIVRCFTPCTVRRVYTSYSGSSFTVPGANSESTLFIKIL